MSTTTFTPRHILPLALATTLTFGGLIPFYSAESAMLKAGLPSRIAVSKTAQPVMVMSSARIAAIGLTLFTFYSQGKLVEVDTVLMTLGYVGLVDGYVFWREGAVDKAVRNAACGLLIAAWGWLGMTAGM